MSEAAHLPIFTLFLDFTSEEAEDQSLELLNLMAEIAPKYENLFKCFWTDDPN